MSPREPRLQRQKRKPSSVKVALQLQSRISSSVKIAGLDSKSLSAEYGKLQERPIILAQWPNAWLSAQLLPEIKSSLHVPTQLCALSTRNGLVVLALTCLESRPSQVTANESGFWISPIPCPGKVQVQGGTHDIAKLLMSGRMPITRVDSGTCKEN